MSENQIGLEFIDIDISDPKVEVSNDSLKITPTYLNFVFLLNFIPMIAGVFVLTQQNELKVNLGCFFLIGLSLFAIIFDQLPFYNTILINTTNKTFTIKPNLLRLLFNKSKVIPFKEIQSFDFHSRGFGASHVRYVVVLNFKKSHVQKVISTSKKEFAGKIVSTFNRIISNS